MMWDDSWHAGQWLAMTLIMLLVVALGALFVVWLVRATGLSGRSSEPPWEPRHATPEEILSERFARGEIDEDEFARRKSLLSGTDHH